MRKRFHDLTPIVLDQADYCKQGGQYLRTRKAWRACRRACAVSHCGVSILSQDCLVALHHRTHLAGAADLALLHFDDNVHSTSPKFLIVVLSSVPGKVCTHTMKFGDHECCRCFCKLYLSIFRMQQYTCRQRFPCLQECYAYTDGSAWGYQTRALAFLLLSFEPAWAAT